MVPRRRVAMALRRRGAGDDGRCSRLDGRHVYYSYGAAQSSHYNTEVEINASWSVSSRLRLNFLRCDSLGVLKGGIQA